LKIEYKEDVIASYPYKNNKVEKEALEIKKLLLSSSFLDAVLNNSFSVSEWETYAEVNFPDKMETAREARDIILYRNKDKKELSGDESQALKLQILRSLT